MVGSRCAPHGDIQRYLSHVFAGHAGGIELMFKIQMYGVCVIARCCCHRRLRSVSRGVHQSDGRRQTVPLFLRD